MRAALLVLGIALAGAAGAAVAEPDPLEQFGRGNHLYEEGRFREAAAAYRALADRAYESPALYFNLANALLKAGELGEALV
jgi:hypothetical protein